MSVLSEYFDAGDAASSLQSTVARGKEGWMGIFLSSFSVKIFSRILYQEILELCIGVSTKKSCVL